MSDYLQTVANHLDREPGCTCRFTDRGTDTIGCRLHDTLASPAYNGIPPFVADSDTSLGAALTLAPNAATLRARVLRCFVDRGERGATDEEAQRYLLMDGDTERPRRIELMRGGYVVRTDTRRRTQAGRWAHVYEVTTAGLTWAALNTASEGLEP